jgi:hypothetical protein
MAAAALVVSVFPAGAQPSNDLSSELPVIHVDTARYGGSLNGSFCDSTIYVKRVCEARNRCAIAISDRLCPADTLSANPLIPTLTVDFHCGASPHIVVRTTEAPATLRLACAGNR